MGRPSKKTSVKTSVGELVPQPHGGALSPGNPGNRGGGRPPNEFKATLRELVDRKEVHAHLLAVLAAGPQHPQFMDVLKYVTEHGYGKAAASVDVTSGGQPLSFTVIEEYVEPDGDGTED